MHLNDVDLHINRDRIFESAATVYFDILKESGKPPKVITVARETARELGIEDLQVSSQICGPDWDAYMVTRRRRRIIEECALKVTAAEFAERIQNQSLSRLVDLLENPEAKVSTKDLIAAAELASRLNAQVDESMSEVTGTGDVTVNVKFKNLLIGLPPERRAAFMSEVLRQGTAPVLEIEDADCDED